MPGNMSPCDPRAIGSVNQGSDEESIALTVCIVPMTSFIRPSGIDIMAGRTILFIEPKIMRPRSCSSAFCKQAT